MADGASTQTAAVKKRGNASRADADDVGGEDTKNDDNDDDNDNDTNDDNGDELERNAEEEGGPARRVQIAGMRFYEVEGGSEPYPSVTTVLRVINKPQLNSWQSQRVARALLDLLTDYGEAGLRKARTNRQFAASLVRRAMNAPEREAQQASTLGSTAHEAIDDAVLEARDSAARAEVRARAQAHGDERVAAVLRNFERFELESGVELTHRDTFVWSHAHRFAGAVDAIGQTRDGALLAFDWKTSNSLHDSYALQLGAYALAWNEMHPDAPVSGAVVVRFDKKRNVYEARRVASLERAQDTFLAALTLFRATTIYASNLPSLFDSKDPFQH